MYPAPSGSDTDVEATPNPDVRRLPTSPAPSGSDTDVEATPNPDVRALASDSDPDVELVAPTPAPWPRPPPRAPPPPDVGEGAELPATQMFAAPHPAVAEGGDDDGATQPFAPPPAPDVAPPPAPDVAPPPGAAPDVLPETQLFAPDPSPRSPGAAEGSAGEAGDDPELFLEPTQNFLPPAPEGAAEEPPPPVGAFGLAEEEEEPPAAPPRPDAWAPPATPPPEEPAEPNEEEEEEEEAPRPRPQRCPRGWSSSTPPKVLFTGVVAAAGTVAALGLLGGSVAASVFDCTHLVTDRVRRTVKFLCALARGVPIVTPEWLLKSARSGCVLPPGAFLVRDAERERGLGFSLAGALRRARRRGLLEGYEVHVTPNVRPEPELMRDIIACSGGTFLPAMPHTYRPRRLVISCGADAGRWGPALGARLPLASAELLLTGLLRQRLQLEAFRLGGPPARGPRPPAPQ
ncbi:mediator of DNA damage checkpoint protein 1-like [Rhea pennata]|uniref:mediator of DNA damage checkpoint protein 1-like n=1 Tax=Rhea pennata TaxID=8795 RepID=UPI002E259AD8